MTPLPQGVITQNANLGDTRGAPFPVGWAGSGLPMDKSLQANSGNSHRRERMFLLMSTAPNWEKRSTVTGKLRKTEQALSAVDPSAIRCGAQAYVRVELAGGGRASSSCAHHARQHEDKFARSGRSRSTTSPAGWQKPPARSRHCRRVSELRNQDGTLPNVATFGPACDARRPALDRKLKASATTGLNRGPLSMRSRANGVIHPARASPGVIPTATNMFQNR